MNLETISLSIITLDVVSNCQRVIFLYRYFSTCGTPVTKGGLLVCLQGYRIWFSTTINDVVQYNWLEGSGRVTRVSSVLHVSDIGSDKGKNQILKARKVLKDC